MWRLVLILAVLTAARVAMEALTTDKGLLFIIPWSAAMATAWALFPVWFGVREARPGEAPARPTLRRRR